MLLASQDTTTIAWFVSLRATNPFVSICCSFSGNLCGITCACGCFCRLCAHRPVAAARATTKAHLRDRSQIPRQFVRTHTALCRRDSVRSSTVAHASGLGVLVPVFFLAPFALFFGPVGAESSSNHPTYRYGCSSVCIVRDVSMKPLLSQRVVCSCRVSASGIRCPLPVRNLGAQCCSHIGNSHRDFGCCVGAGLTPPLVCAFMTRIACDGKSPQRHVACIAAGANTKHFIHQQGILWSTTCEPLLTSPVHRGTAPNLDGPEHILDLLMLPPHMHSLCPRLELHSAKKSQTATSCGVYVHCMGVPPRGGRGASDAT